MLEIKDIREIIIREMSLELWFVWIFIVSFFIIDTAQKRYHRIIGTLIFIFSGFIFFLYLPVKPLKMKLFKEESDSLLILMDNEIEEFYINFRNSMFNFFIRNILLSHDH